MRPKRGAVRPPAISVYDELGIAPPETGQFVYSFTLRLPFVLGISAKLTYDLGPGAPYACPSDREVFGPEPYVRLRLANAPIADHKFEPANMKWAIDHLYDVALPDIGAEGIQLYEQWVALETPAVFLEGENQRDPAYAFHRSLAALNLFLGAFALSRQDDKVRTISARELRPIVFIGSIDLEGAWTPRGEMLMHPDAKERPLGAHDARQHLDAINAAIVGLNRGDPFLNSQQWLARAERRKYEGDATDAVVSYQVAAETFAYDLWSLLLIDEGTSQGDLSSLLGEEVAYRTLLTRHLAPRLGGSWDVTLEATAIGRYWRDLYTLRNRIVHTGYVPHDGDADEARVAVAGFYSFVASRTRLRRKRLPTTYANISAFPQL